MSEPTKRNTEAVMSGCPPVPQSIMTASREELDNIPLDIEGELPEDLLGHVFIVAPVGSVESGGLPYKDGDSYLNGDGMIYRLDFDPKNRQVKLKTRIAKPLDYYVDKATKDTFWGFRNHGLIRFSFFLGARNELNTAFLPMTYPGDKLARLLVNYDGGRPYEIDTETLETVTPVGARSEWQAELEEPNYPFNPILSTAHPAYDTYTQQAFTVNYGRSLENFIETVLAIDGLPPEVAQYLQQVSGLKDFVYLVCWDGENPLARWKLVNPDRSPVIIKQSIHQIGLSRDYVVLMDTAFTVGLEQVINNPAPKHPDLEIKLRNLLEHPPSPNTTLYIVDRTQLERGQILSNGEPEVEVVAQKVVIPFEACHFLVDYENPDNKITLHVAHICAWDVAEWLRSYDRSPYPGSSIPPHLRGTQQGEMDISRMGRYVIDANTLGNNPNIESKVISDPVCTWGPGLFAYRERLPSGMTPPKLDNIYWISFGLWKELMTDFMYQLYKNYNYQAVLPREKVLELATQGKPACLYRLNTSSNQSLAIADYYCFPASHMVLSPQFVPRTGDESSTNGYITCTVFTPERSEIWIFDASKLNEGALCKLHHDKFKVGLSLHTAWLPNIGRRQAKYKISVWQDYFKLVDNLHHSPEVTEKIDRLLESEVYPHFPGELKPS